MKRVRLCMLAIFCWGAALWCGSGILTRKGLLSLRLDGKDAGITAQTLEQMSEKYHVAAFAETGRITVRAPDTGREAEVSVIVTAGDSGLITGSRPESGSFGLNETGECLISRTAALELFGNEAAAGLTVTLERKDWLIRGVLDAKRSVILLPAEKETLLTNLEFQFSGTGDNREEAEQACYLYGISGHCNIIDYGFFGAVVRFCLWLPFLAVLLLLKKIKKKIKEGCPAAVTRNVWCYGLEFLFWVGVLVFHFQAIRFPSGFIPAQWSDFQFWSLKSKEAAEWMWILFHSALIKDTMLRNQFVAGSGFAAASAVFLYRAGARPEEQK